MMREKGTKKPGLIRLAGLAATVAALTVALGILNKLFFRKKHKEISPHAE